MAHLKQIKIPTFTDPRGDLSAIEMHEYAQWPVKRIYYVTNTKSERGGHAVRGEKKMYVCVQGNMLGRFHDGEKWHEFEMKGPDDAVLMEGLCWREFKNFSLGAVLVAISNMNYDKDTYIMDFEEFLKEVNGGGIMGSDGERHDS